MVHVRLEQVALTEGRGAVLGTEGRAAPWSRFDYLLIAPGMEHAAPPAPPGEEVVVLLAGQGAAQAGCALVEAAAPAVLLAPPGGRCVLRNTGSTVLRALHLGVLLPDQPAPAAPEPRTAWRRDVAEAARLAWRPAIHGGHGQVATRHLWGSGDFASAWTFVDHAILAPDSSLGRHCHETGEEAFVVLRGEGRMLLGRHAFTVGPGSVTFQAAGQPHALLCPGPDELEFLRLAVALPGRAFTTRDLPGGHALQG